MAVVREDVVKVTYDVDSKPLDDVDKSLDDLVDNTKKMAGDSGVGNITKGFQSLANSAKEFAKTKIDSVKQSLDKFKTSLTGGEKGAKGLLNVVKNIGKAGFKTVINGCKKLVQGLGKALAAAGKLAAKLAGMTIKGLMTGLAAAATGIVAIGTSAVKAYAEYEQLKGGVETLFGDGASKTILKYANNAYKTAGLSANAYMETVTGFSASLLQSLGGDTAKAAAYADRAVTDMADNANKLGTPIDQLQTAYAGFAKQNYSLLDNLKLGYGGTKEEMARLISDASKMTDVQEKLGITVDESSMSFDNVVNAISVMQSKMGIAGATLGEAEKTIQGSFSAMKGAWTNFVAGLANEDADIDQLVGNLVDSVVTFGKNLIPRIKVMLPRLVDGFTQLAQAIATELPGIISDILPSIVSGATALMTAFITALQDNLGLISDTAITLIMQFVDFILNSLPQIITVGIRLLTSLIVGIAQKIPALIPVVFQAIFTIVNSLKQNLPTIIQAGVQIILALNDGLSQMLPSLIPMVVQLILTFIMGIVNNLPAIIQSGVNVIVALVQGIANAIPMIVSAIPQIFAGIIDAIMSVNWLKVGWDIIKAIGGGLWEGVKALFDGGKEAGEAAGEGVAAGFDTTSAVATTEMSSFATSTTQYGATAATNMATGLSTNGVAITTAATDTMTATDLAMQTGMNTIATTVGSTDLTSSGVAVMQGLNDGMESMIPTLEATAAKAAAAIKTATDSALDIHSPSRVMEETGEFAGLGQAKGLRNTIPDIQVAAREVSSASIPYDTYSPDSGSTYYSGGNSEFTTVSPQFNLTISGTQDDRAMARRVKRYVAEAIQETFESLERKSYSMREA